MHESVTASIRRRLKSHPLLYDAARLSYRLSYRTFDQLRVTYALHRRQAIITAYCNAHPVRKLNLGAGPTGLKGWLNCDLQPTTNACIYLDVRRRFPFEDRLFDYIFSEHLIEHVSLEDGEFFLRECLRCVKPGGRIRIATPDLRRLVAGYLTEDSASQHYANSMFDRYFRQVATKTPAGVLNNAMHNWGHQFLYDEETLGFALETSGFRNVIRQQVGVSEDPELRGVEIHGNAIGSDLNEYETMVVEATRPLLRRAGDGKAEEPDCPGTH